MKKLKTEEMQLRIAKNKRRSLGNIRFIGELFKLSMLTEKIMHECILQLLKSIDEESLECMYRLLTTVGKLIDTDKGKVRSCKAPSDLGRFMFVVVEVVPFSYHSFVFHGVVESVLSLILCNF